MTKDPPKDVRDALASHADDYEIRRELPSRDPNGVYEVSLDGTRAVCKVARGENAHVGRHALVSRYVHDRTATPTPRVLGFDEDYALLMWADGVAYEGDEPRNLRKRRLHNAGATLANLHAETDFEAHGYLRARNRTLELDARGTWSDMLEAIVDGWTDDLEGTRFEDIGESVLTFVCDNAERFDISDGPDLVHGDFQPENVRFDGERVVAVFDWEFSLAGAGEFDLCRAEREFFDWHDAPECDDGLRDALRAGYESVRPLPPEFEARREIYRAVLKLDPMRFFDDWKRKVEAPDATATSMCEFVHESIADAEEAFDRGESR